MILQMSGKNQTLQTATQGPAPQPTQLGSSPPRKGIFSSPPFSVPSLVLSSSCVPCGAPGGDPDQQLPRLEGEEVEQRGSSHPPTRSNSSLRHLLQEALPEAPQPPTTVKPLVYPAHPPEPLGTLAGPELNLCGADRSIFLAREGPSSRLRLGLAAWPGSLSSPCSSHWLEPWSVP